VSIGVSIYAVELLLTFLSVDERVKIAKEFGVDFDTRSILEVIRDLEKQHISAVPNIFPIALFKKQADGTVKYEKTTRPNDHNNYPSWMPNSRRNLSCFFAPRS